MKRRTIHWPVWAFFFLLGLPACEENGPRADAYGNFEAREVLVSAEMTGKLVWFEVEEGQTLQSGQLIGLVDTTQLDLRRRQLEAAIRAVRAKTQDAGPQVAVLEEQKANLLRERDRVAALLRDQAATPKQLDDIEGQIEVIDQQIDAARRNTGTLNAGILSEIEPLQVQVRQVEDQLRKCRIVNPVDGTVLLKLAEPAEFTAAGKPLYKIADLSTMTLRAYVSGAQLPHIRLGQSVQVLIDEDEETNRSLPGTITWIAGQAEFTPKIVQTKEERVSLVYAVKIAVVNDGALKIGMPGEVLFGEAGPVEAEN